MSSECKTCKRPVMWLTNDKTGKAAPIDLMPDDAGNVVILAGDRYRVLTKGERAQPVAEQRHTSHWQTCPDREDWKRAQR